MAADEPEMEIDRWSIEEGHHRTRGPVGSHERPFRVSFTINASKTWMAKFYDWLRTGRDPKIFFPPIAMPEPNMRIVTAEIDNLAARAMALELNDWPAPWAPPENVEDIRSVLAEWLEEGGDLTLARFLRPLKPFPDRPSDVDWTEDAHTKGRRWTLNAIREAYTKRDAIAAGINAGLLVRNVTP